MAENKRQKEEEKNEQQIREQAGENVRSYFALSKMLFGMGDKSPYDINELKEDSEFYKPAKELAEELEIDWDKMTHEESNRIMLSLLDDCYNRIRIDDGYKYQLQIALQKKK